MLEKRNIRAQIVIIENGKYILLKHHHKKENRYFWGLPGGAVEPDETPEDAAIREAKEETGLDIQLLPFKLVVENPKETNMYKKKVTFIGYPIDGEASTGYDPEEEMILYFELVDLKWQDINDLDIDEIAKRDIIPIRRFLYNNLFIKKSGMLVYKIEKGIIKYLLVRKDAIYDLPNGYREKNESKEQAAYRSTKVQAGVIATIIKELGFYFHKENGIIYQTTIFLGKYETSESFAEHWITINDVDQILITRETKRFILDVQQTLMEG